MLQLGTGAPEQCVPEMIERENVSSVFHHPGLAKVVSQYYRLQYSESISQSVGGTD